jgi:MSHA biogenesis protein MshG
VQAQAVLVCAATAARDLLGDAMATFSYRARDASGVLVTGRMEAEAQQAVAQQLLQTGYVPTVIEPAWTVPSLANLSVPFRRVRADDLILFTRQLEVLSRAGIPLLESLETLTKQARTKVFQQVIQGVARSIEAGATLSDAMGRYPQAFPEVYVSTVRAGELGGFLDLALERLAALGEHEAETQARIKAAVRYPIFVVTAIGIALVIIVTFVVPKFALLYGAFRATLPLPTRIAFAVGLALQRFWYLAVAGTVVAVGGVRLALGVPGIRLWWDEAKLKLPILGPVILKLSLSRWAHILSLLVRSGVPILKSLEVVARSVDNAALSRSILAVADAAERGEALAEAMARDPLFPPLVVQMVAVGERTGELEALLLKVSEHYDREADYAIRNLSSALEPILLVIIGGMVFFLALAVFLPMWDMVRLIRR